MPTLVTIFGLLLISSVIIVAQNPSKILELESTTQGFLPPVINKAQITDIGSPVEGLMVYCTDCRDKGPHFYNGAHWIGPGNLPHDLSITDAYNPVTGKVWMDRNLGAAQVAISSTDAAAYGDLNQWGRAADGHQFRTSATTVTLSGNDVPGHGDFILVPDPPFDWRSPINDNLWQAVSGINNPCPTGYRLPTEAEWEAERLSWSTNDTAGAFASPLKLPRAGYRDQSNGLLYGGGFSGVYWSSTASSTSSLSLFFENGDAFMGTYGRAIGSSVRCLKD